MNHSRENMILIVDDAKENIDILFQALVDDYELSVAVDGESALEYVSTNPPDLILLDIMMPGMDGFEVCRRLKKDPETSAIPVIFLSAMNELESKTAGFESGAVDYVTKPFEILEVKARVKTHLDLRNALKTINQYNKQLEEIVERRTKELIRTERQAAFSLLIQGIVHNLKNPLSGIIGSSQLILKYGNILKSMLLDIPEDVKNKEIKYIEGIIKFSEMVHGSGTQMNEMINSMMSKSRSDKSDKIEMVYLNDILKQEVEFLNADQLFKHKITKHININEQLPKIKLVPSEIAQVFQNLVRNAIHALWNHPKPSITIGSGTYDKGVWFSVEDNGPGIPKNILSVIFDPFFTTKPKASEEKNSNEPVGTGLGLYSCLEIIKTYNGKIDVNTTVGKGTTFIVYLPQQQ
ncbi:MAG: hybrid sensor histidine kinase/response regulator [Desulfobacterales bacterium]|nr:hybrid sensor histidine kinase/response regulator [Desulfobacterales bacterium]